MCSFLSSETLLSSVALRADTESTVSSLRRRVCASKHEMTGINRLETCDRMSSTEQLTDIIQQHIDS